jgi:hypothetical protein
MAAGADGARAAEQAAAHARSCGMPDGRPIYFALDVDPASLTSLQWLAVEQFIDAAAGAIGRDAVGVYGGYAAIERLVPARARWGWQTYAWSGGRWSTKAQLTQYRNGVALAGGTVDLCRSTTTDFGQWSQEDEDRALSEDQAKALELLPKIEQRSAAMWKLLIDEGTIGRRTKEMTLLLRAAAAGGTNDSLDVDEAELARELAPVMLPSLIEALAPDIGVIVAAVPAALRPALAEALTAAA